jgi:hypothetical protein
MAWKHGSNISIIMKIEVVQIRQATCDKYVYVIPPAQAEIQGIYQGGGMQRQWS